MIFLTTNRTNPTNPEGTTTWPGLFPCRPLDTRAMPHKIPGVPGRSPRGRPTNTGEEPILWTINLTNKNPIRICSAARATPCILPRMAVSCCHDGLASTTHVRGTESHSRSKEIERVTISMYFALPGASMLNQRHRSLLIVAILLLTLGGCVHEDLDGPTRTFTYELWLPLSVFLGGVLAAPAGLFLRNSSSRFGWGLLLGGPIAALFFAPSLFRDRVVVSDTSLSIRSGIWGLTALHEVKYDDLRGVRIISEQVTGRRGSKRTNYCVLAASL